jgi:leucyl aminopeptidase
MTVAALTVSPEPATTIDTDVLVIGVSKTSDGPRLLSDDPAVAALQDQLELIGVSGAVDELRRLPSSTGSARSIALVGLGSTTTPDDLRYAAGTAARQLRGIDSLVIALPTTTPEDVLAVLEGASIGAYGYTEYRVSSLKSTKAPASTIIVASAVPDSANLVERASATALAVHTVRDLVNAPPSHIYPETLAQASVDLAKGLPVEVEVLAEEELAAGGFGGILGVGLGSSRGPRLVKVTYSPAGAERHLALVGKGITFDSGGLSLKPPASMIGMKYDMTGAATALAVTLAAAQLALPVRITAWLCIAENMPSGTAARPNDVLTMRGGKTVEVLNTDAEGRLILADGIVAAGEEDPDAIIDIATLTGAQVVALGNRYVGAMGDDALVTQIVATATRVGETLWPMPLPAYLRPLLNSDVADIANIKPGNVASGMLIAGVFLQDFVGSTGEGDAARTIPWAHLDIAGPAENAGGGYGYTPHGPTGVTVRSLLALAEEFSLA